MMPAGVFKQFKKKYEVA